MCFILSLPNEWVGQGRRQTLNLGWAREEHFLIFPRYFLPFFLNFFLISFLSLVLWVGGLPTQEGPDYTTGVGPICITNYTTNLLSTLVQTKDFIALVNIVSSHDDICPVIPPWCLWVCVMPYTPCAVTPWVVHMITSGLEHMVDMTVSTYAKDLKSTVEEVGWQAVSSRSW